MIIYLKFIIKNLTLILINFLVYALQYLKKKIAPKKMKKNTLKSCFEILFFFLLHCSDSPNRRINALNVANRSTVYKTGMQTACF